MRRKSLHIEIKRGESIAIDGGRLILRLEEKSGQRARLHCNAEHDVSIEPVRESEGSSVNVQVNEKPLGTFAF